MALLMGTLRWLKPMARSNGDDNEGSVIKISTEKSMVSGILQNGIQLHLAYGGREINEKGLIIGATDQLVVPYVNIVSKNGRTVDFIRRADRLKLIVDRETAVAGSVTDDDQLDRD